MGCSVLPASLVFDDASVKVPASTVEICESLFEASAFEISESLFKLGPESSKFIFSVMLRESFVPTSPTSNDG